MSSTLDTYPSLPDDSTIEDGDYIALEPFSFHLLSGEKESTSFILDCRGHEDRLPTKQEIIEYIHEYVKGYVFSRWLEIILMGRDVPVTILPKDSQDWAGDKIGKACGGECSIFFADSEEIFSKSIKDSEGKDALIIYIGGIDYKDKFSHTINTVLNTILNNPENYFIKNAIKRGVSLRQMLVASIMEFAITQSGREGVIINGSLVRNHISYKILRKYKENSEKKGGGNKPSHSQKGAVKGNGKEDSVTTKVDYSLRI